MRLAAKNTGMFSSYRYFACSSAVCLYSSLHQRLYHALTSSNPPPGPPYTSSTNFAAIRAGPGTAKPLHTSADTEGIIGVTTYRVSTKDREFVNEVHFKGWTLRLADWVHMANPDDPSRPIVGQIFRCFVWDAAYVAPCPLPSLSWLRASHLAAAKRDNPELQLRGTIAQSRLAKACRSDTPLTYHTRPFTLHTVSSGKAKSSRQVSRQSCECDPLTDR